MTIICGGYLSLALYRICRDKNPIKMQRFCRSYTHQAKRIGIYYLCIDNLLMLFYNSNCKYYSFVTVVYKP